MNSQILTTMLLVVAAGIVMYLVGERRARRAATSASPAPPPPSAKQAGATTAPSSIGIPTPTTPVTMSSLPPDSAPKVLTVVPDRESAGAFVKINYEEDDEVEPTKIGRMAEAPEPPRVIIQPPVKPIVLDSGADEEEPTGATSLFLVSATAQTDKGLRRKRNEDCVGVLESKNLFIVADGMGGYAGGDRASKLAVDTVVDAYRSNTFEGDPHEAVSREGSQLARAIQTANTAIADEAKKNKELKDMGTTICAAVFSPNKERLHIGHVGDSRCYRLRDGIFKQLTADHTMAEQGVRGPEGQQLSRAVGIWPTVVIDIVQARPQTGDVYLLCSDGLTKMLNDDLIGNVLRNEEDPKVAVERLIFFANSRGGKDNITVILIRVVPIHWMPKAPPPSATDRGTA